MSEDEKYAVIGKAMSQYVVEKREVALLAGRIRGFAESLKSLGALLQELPGTRTLEPLAAWQQAKKSQLVDSEQIAGLLDEYHARQQTLVGLRKQLGELGIPEPER
jgi:hypothetical protein